MLIVFGQLQSLVLAGNVHLCTPYERKWIDIYENAIRTYRNLDRLSM